VPRHSSCEIVSIIYWKRQGNPTLMSEELMDTLCDHSVGNYRIMTTLANELLEEVLSNKNSLIWMKSRLF